MGRSAHGTACNDLAFEKESTFGGSAQIQINQNSFFTAVFTEPPDNGVKSCYFRML
jgi:hypothetical protein